MVIIVRFYWQHDLDLIALSKHPDFNMSRWLKKAIIAYTRKDGDFSIPLPEEDISYRVALDNCCLHIRFSTEKEADVIEFLNGFRSGHRNSAIKTIFRRYLEGVYLAPYFNEETFAVKSRVHSSDGSANDKNRTTPHNNGSQFQKVSFSDNGNKKRTQKEKKSPADNGRKNKISTTGTRTPSETDRKTKTDISGTPGVHSQISVSADTGSGYDIKTEETDEFDLFSSLDKMNF